MTLLSRSSDRPSDEAASRARRERNDKPAAGLLAAGGALTILAPLPLLMAVALMALEFLVAALQAYVFTVLTCIYLNDALHPGH